MISKMRIAIIGSGLAGASVANTLFQHPHLDVHVYEPASEFSERGAALSRNSQLVLQHVTPKAGAVAQASARSMIGSGPHGGTIVFDMGSEAARSVVVHPRIASARTSRASPHGPASRWEKLSHISATAEGVEVPFIDVSLPSELDRAFEAYDAVRRDRAQRVIDSSRGTGRILCG